MKNTESELGLYFFYDSVFSGGIYSEMIFMLSSCHKVHTILSKCFPSLRIAVIKTVIMNNIIDL